MTAALYLAALLAFVVGLAHSLLGERYILRRLIRRDDLPKLFGETAFTARTLRFAWHITSIAWWGFAVILLQLADGSITARSVELSIGVTFVATGLIALVISRARHLAWLAFLVVGGLALAAGL